MTSALLSFLLMWPPVVETCTGLPTAGVQYEVAYVYAECTNWQGDWDQVGCSRFEARVDVGYATRWETEIGHPDPPVGAGWWFEVRSRSALGVWNDGECL